jgi:16S rRNA G966 N2-methylase RsmD
MCGLVEANLDLCGVPEEMTEVALSEAADFLRRLEARGGEPYDIAFLDPPYAIDYAPILELFGVRTTTLLAEGGILIVEHHHKNMLKDATGKVRRWRILKQGDSALSFYEAEKAE